MMSSSEGYKHVLVDTTIVPGCVQKIAHLPSRPRTRSNTNEIATTENSGNAGGAVVGNAREEAAAVDQFARAAPRSSLAASGTGRRLPATRGAREGSNHNDNNDDDDDQSSGSRRGTPRPSWNGSTRFD